MCPLTLPSRWLLANLSPSLSQTRLFIYSSTHTHINTDTLIYACTRITRVFPSTGCQDTDERQFCHCVVLYYTCNSELHAFLNEVICTGTASVGVHSVNETVLALIYIPLSHWNCSSEDIQPSDLGTEDYQTILFLSHAVLWEKKRDIQYSFIHCTSLTVYSLPPSWREIVKPFMFCCLCIYLQLVSYWF